MVWDPWFLHRVLGSFHPRHEMIEQRKNGVIKTVYHIFTWCEIQPRSPVKIFNGLVEHSSSIVASCSVTHSPVEAAKCRRGWWHLYCDLSWWPGYQNWVSGSQCIVYTGHVSVCVYTVAAGAAGGRLDVLDQVLCCCEDIQQGVAFILNSFIPTAHRTDFSPCQ